MPRSSRPLLALACLAPLLAACTEEPPAVSYDPEQIIAESIDFATALERLDYAPVPSVHGTMDGLAEFYANESAAEVFRGIDVGDPSATAEFPRGALLVKNLLDINGEPLGVLTILAKFEAGYGEKYDDWFFAMVNFEGEVIDDMIGNGPSVYHCYDCHQQQAPNTDLVIGLEPGQLR